MSFSDDPLYCKVSEALDGFRKRYLERLEKEQKRLKACKINTVIQSKRAQELKLNSELKAKLSELTSKGDNLDRLCANFASGVTISKGDQQRLDNAKEMIDVGKKLTGIRFDYSAPQHIVKGYIKSEIHRTLTPFELSADADVSERLWEMIGDAADKENRADN